MRRIKQRVDTALIDVSDELDQAYYNWPDMCSAHEGISLLKEEVDELWDIVKKKPHKRNLHDMRKEALQIAAMAIRFMVDVCNEEVGRK